jgi:Calcineurin-like phosphoesterase
MSVLDDLQNDFIRQFRTIPGVATSIFELVAYLESSQYQLIELMVHNGIWQGPVPPDPGGDGAMELGMVPYWIKYPPPFIQDYVDSNWILKGVWAILTTLIPDKFSPENYNALKCAAEINGVVADDGTLFGESTYEQLDPHWMWAYANYLIVKFADDRASFATKDPAQVTPVELSGATAGQVTIAIVGDWGTGFYEPNSAAQLVIDQILAMPTKPDYIIHLGDVYYAGTADLFFPLNEEQDNFLNAWPTAEQFPAGKSFTLNSNHEMYGGAKGYYTALADPRFAAQDGLSYFALKYGGWTLLGLDSAYFTTSNFYMAGSIGGNAGIQTTWMQQLGISADKTIVMTHHTGLSASGATETA